MSCCAYRCRIHVRNLAITRLKMKVETSDIMTSCMPRNQLAVSRTNDDDGAQIFVAWTMVSCICSPCMSAVRKPQTVNFSRVFLAISPSLEARTRLSVVETLRGEIHKVIAWKSGF